MVETNLIGQIIGGCRIDSFIGKGGMGKVFLAHNLNLDIPVAIKVMSANLGTSRELVERFILEARAAARLHSEHIVRVFDVGEENGLYFLQMEFVKGESLASYLSRNTPIGVPLALHFLQQVVRGLNNAHGENIIHRDIKPDNILISNKGILKIADFGLVKLMSEDNHLTATGQVLGTPYYISPEQCEGKATDGRSDIYSLGIVMFYMLTGKLPFEGQSSLTIVVARLQNDPPPVKSFREDIPDDVDSLILKMMARNVENRYQNTESLLADIQQLIQVYAKDYRYSADRLGINLPKPSSGTDTSANTIVVNSSSENTILNASTKSLFKHNSKTIVSSATNNRILATPAESIVNEPEPKKKSGFLMICLGIVVCALLASIAYRWHKEVSLDKQIAQQEEQDRLAKEEKDRLAKEEKDRLAKEEKDRLAKEEKDRLAKEEQDRLAKEEQDRLAKEEQDRLAKEEQDRLAEDIEQFFAKQTAKSEKLLQEFKNKAELASSREELKKIRDRAIEKLEQLQRETEAFEMPKDKRDQLPEWIHNQKTKMKKIYSIRQKEIKRKNPNTRKQNDREKDIHELKKEAALKLIEGLKIIAEGMRFPRAKKIVHDFVQDLESDIQNDNFDNFLDLLNKTPDIFNHNKDFFQNREQFLMEFEQLENMEENDDEE